MCSAVCVFTNLLFANNICANMVIKYSNICVIFGLLCLTLPLGAQPTACSEDSQCPSGFYCEIAHFCRECLSCVSLKREPPPVIPGSCAKSVLECGPCIEGLVEDLRLDRACVSPGERSGGDDGISVPVFTWLCIGLLILGFGAIAVYVVCRKDWNIFRIRTSTHASVHCPQSNRNGAVRRPSEPAQPVVPQLSATAQPALPRPSAPTQTLPPPPYSFDTPPNSFDTPPAVHPTAHTPAAPQLYPNGHTVEDDLATPLIKRDSQKGASGVREAAGHQAALPFNTPRYVRAPAPGLGRTSLERDENMDAAMVNGFRPHDDEDTMESNWMPNEPLNNNAINASHSVHVTDGAGDAPAPALARALAPAPAPAPAADADAHDRRGSNYSRRRDSGGDDASGQPARPAEVIISVITNINNVEQRNNVQLPKL